MEELLCEVDGGGAGLEGSHALVMPSTTSALATTAALTRKKGGLALIAVMPRVGERRGFEKIDRRTMRSRGRHVA